MAIIVIALLAILKSMEFAKWIAIQIGFLIIIISNAIFSKECLYKKNLRSLCSSCDGSLHKLLNNYKCICSEGYYETIDGKCEFCDT